MAAALHAPAGTFNIVDDEPLTKLEYAEALARAARDDPVAVRARPGGFGLRRPPHFADPLPARQ